MHSTEPELDASRVLDFLALVGPEIPREITLVAAGGTALTLLKVKASTRDIDFTGPAADIHVFRRTLQGVPHGMKVDMWPDGQVFSQFLPADYLARSRTVARLTNVDLRALHPVDIVVTKAGRLDARDEQDIRDCIRAFRITKAAISRRAARVEYVGNRDNYEHNVDLVLRTFFKSKG